MLAERALTPAKAHCRNCSGSELIWHRRYMAMEVPQGYPLSGEVAVVRCETCGFVGNHSPAGADAYVEYYTRFNKHHSRNGDLRNLDAAYFESLLDLVESHAAIDWSGTDVLDWGSGALLFGERATQRGARSAHNYDMAGDFPALDYGFITSTHCFEHILDFGAEFARIRDALGEHGLFLVATPDLRGYHESYWGPYSAFDLEHINHFEIASLSDALVRAGFDIVATRESERLVTPTLAYPEILVLARKSGAAASRNPLVSKRPAPEAVLERYLDRAETDMGKMVDSLRDTLADCEQRGLAVSPGLYGVASYAFRLVRVLGEEHDFHFSWFADSDVRLGQKLLDGTPIADPEAFEGHVARCEAEGVRCLAFVAAINASSITAYLQKRFGERIEVIELPPVCQNRLDAASPAD